MQLTAPTVATVTGPVPEVPPARIPIVALLSALEHQDRDRFFRILREHVAGPITASELITTLADEDTRPRRLAMHWVLDCVRSHGLLPEVRDRLLQGRNCSAMVREVLSQAEPKIRPVIIAHRGDAIDHPENTVASIAAALGSGSKGVEVDITITKDQEIVLWHDHHPFTHEALVRAIGAEEGMKYRPAFPGLLSRFRRPIRQLTLAELKATHGYKRREDSIFTGNIDVEIDTLRDAFRCMQQYPSLECIVLDVKLPHDNPKLAARFARRLSDLLNQADLWEKVVVMHTDPENIKTLRQNGLEQAAFTQEVEIVELYPQSNEFSASRRAKLLHNTVASIGRPRVSFNGYRCYLDILRYDRAALDGFAGKHRLITWTINDELEFREILAIGVDGVITDNPKLMREVVKNLFESN